MIDQLWAIVEPGADRIYYSHSPPTEYQRKPGVRIFLVEVVFPDPDIADGAMTVHATEEQR